MRLLEYHMRQVDGQLIGLILHENIVYLGGIPGLNKFEVQISLAVGTHQRPSGTSMVKGSIFSFELIFKRWVYPIERVWLT